MGTHPRHIGADPPGRSCSIENNTSWRPKRERTSSVKVQPTTGQHLEGLLVKGEPWAEAATWIAELLLSFFPFCEFSCTSKRIHCLPVRTKTLHLPTGPTVLSYQERRLSWLERNTHASPCWGLLFLLQEKRLSSGSDGDGERTHVYQARGELESRRTEKTSPGNAKHARSWDGVQCILGEGSPQQRPDEPENK